MLGVLAPPNKLAIVMDLEIFLSENSGIILVQASIGEKPGWRNKDF
jgi:hypothetical protein